MRLCFIHGINNEDNTPASIEAEWWSGLTESAPFKTLPAKPKPQISVAYYADILAAGVTKAVEQHRADVAAGRVSETESDPERTNGATGLGVGLIRDYARAAGVSEAEWNSALVSAGTSRAALSRRMPNRGVVLELAAVIEHLIPTHGKLLAKLFLRQAAAYIDDGIMAAQIDEIVRATILEGGSEPMVIVAHSLGTVVGYRVLAGAPTLQARVKLFVTLGSPLAVDMFTPILPARDLFPAPPITQWVNGRNVDDFVALNRALTKSTIGYDGVVNLPAIKNQEEDKHSIRNYLQNPAVAQVIYDAL
jgi:hypothetical protein